MVRRRAGRRVRDLHLRERQRLCHHRHHWALRLPREVQKYRPNGGADQRAYFPDSVAVVLTHRAPDDAVAVRAADNVADDVTQ